MYWQWRHVQGTSGVPVALVLPPGEGGGGGREDVHAVGDHVVDVHGGHVAEQEDAFIELGLHQLGPELLEDSETNTEGVGGVAQQEPVPEVEDFVKRKHVTEHCQEPGNGVKIGNKTL